MKIILFLPELIKKIFSCRACDPIYVLATEWPAYILGIGVSFLRIIHHCVRPLR